MNPFSAKKKKAITFDFGDTLASTVPTYPERIRQAIEMCGSPIAEDVYTRAYMRADYETFVRYRKFNTLDERKRMEWLFEIVCRESGIQEDYRQLKQAVLRNINNINYRDRVLLDSAGEILEQLKDRGYILAIISNNDGRVESKCETLGIRSYFDLIVDSGNLGLIKPGKEIFIYTLKELGLDGGDVIHIGDLYGADVLGAKNAGINPVWINRTNSPDFDNTGVFQIKNLGELKDILL